jgi:LAO/AO transport system kinase
MEMLEWSGWIPELVATQALSGEGIEQLWAAIERHMAYLNETGEIEGRRRDAFMHQVRQLALGRIERRLDHLLESESSTGIDPYEAADRVIPKLGL